MTSVEPPFATPGDALAAQAARRPGAPALAFPRSGGRLDFAAWDAASTALARGLVALGLRPGDRVALLAENRIEWPVVQVAAARAAAVLVPLNTHHGEREIADALRRSGARAAFVSRAFRGHEYLRALRDLRGRLPALEHLVCLDGRAPGEGPDVLAPADLAARGAGTPLPAVGPDDPAALLYTSGTTGAPKGALLTHRSMLWDAWSSARRLGLGPEDRWTSMIPLFHCAGCIMSVLGCLQTGAAYVGLPAFDPELLMATVEAERCTVLSAVPTAYVALLDHPARPRFDLSTLRAGTCGGADVDPDLLERCAGAFPVPGLCQVYGQTETSTLAACPRPDDPERFATAGPPLDGCEVRITDPRTGAPLPAGEVGQIEVRGPVVMRGYFEDPGATAEVLDARGWLRTGDLGLLTPTGRVRIAGGRLRDLVIRGGENVYPVEVENVLAAHPAVRLAAVFGVADRYYGEVVAAAVAVAADVAAADLARFARERLAGFKVPSLWYRTDDPPLTASGKVRKNVLRERAAAGELDPLP